MTSSCSGCRTELVARGLTAETLERSIAIALHFCRECCVASPDHARSILQLVLESFDWDEWSREEYALREFAYELARQTGYYG